MYIYISHRWHWNFMFSSLCFCPDFPCLGRAGLFSLYLIVRFLLFIVLSWVFSSLLVILQSSQHKNLKKIKKWFFPLFSPGFAYNLHIWLKRLFLPDSMSRRKEHFKGDCESSAAVKTGWEMGTASMVPDLIPVLLLWVHSLLLTKGRTGQTDSLYPH